MTRVKSTFVGTSRRVRRTPGNFTVSDESVTAVILRYSTEFGSVGPVT